MAALQAIATDTTAADIETLQQDARDVLERSPLADFQMEAELLRSGIEKLIENGETVRSLVEFYDDEIVVRESDLRELLDGVDARDSLAWLEKVSAPEKPTVQP